MIKFKFLLCFIFTSLLTSVAFSSCFLDITNNLEGSIVLQSITGNISDENIAYEESSPLSASSFDVPIDSSDEDKSKGKHTCKPAVEFLDPQNKGTPSSFKMMINDTLYAGETISVDITDIVDYLDRIEGLMFNLGKSDGDMFEGSKFHLGQSDIPQESSSVGFQIPSSLSVGIQKSPFPFKRFSIVSIGSQIGVEEEK